MPRISWEARFDKLYNYFGSHSAVARALNITVRHYMGLRRDPSRIKGAIRNLLLVYCRVIDLSVGYSQVKKHIHTICREDW